MIELEGRDGTREGTTPAATHAQPTSCTRNAGRQRHMYALQIYHEISVDITDISQIFEQSRPSEAAAAGCLGLLSRADGPPGLPADAFAQAPVGGDCGDSDSETGDETAPWFL